jgi:hypothetical protein
LGAAHPSSDKYAGRFTIAYFKHGTGIRYGLAGSDESELADAIQHAKPRRAEMGCAIERHLAQRLDISGADATGPAIA